MRDNIKRMQTRDRVENELRFIQSAADILQVAASNPDDDVSADSISDMMMRVHDSAERVGGLVFPESPEIQKEGEQ